jgi:hypothetical protein
VTEATKEHGSKSVDPQKGLFSVVLAPGGLLAPGTPMCRKQKPKDITSCRAQGTKGEPGFSGQLAVEKTIKVVESKKRKPEENERNGS